MNQYGESPVTELTASVLCDRLSDLVPALERLTDGICQRLDTLIAYREAELLDLRSTKVQRLAFAELAVACNEISDEQRRNPDELIGVSEGLRRARMDRLSARSDLDRFDLRFPRIVALAMLEADALDAAAMAVEPTGGAS